MATDTATSSDDLHQAADDMAPRTYKCLKAGCNWSQDLEPDVGPIWLKDHLDTEHAVVPKAKPPSLPLPKLSGQISMEIFEEFCREWENWKTSSNVEAGKETSYLIGCCEQSLKLEVQASTCNITAKPENEMLELLQKHAVITKAKSAMITELLNIRQAEDETIRKYKSRIDAVARNCGLEIKCTHACCADKAKVQFADIVVKHVMVNGLHDEDTRKEVLGTASLDEKTLADTVTIIEAKETALRSMPGYRSGSEKAAMSSYRKETRIAKTDSRLQLTGKCEKCAKVFKNRHLQTGRGKPDEVKTLKLCHDCWAEARKQKSGKNGSRPDSAAARDGASDNAAANNTGGGDDFLASEDGKWQTVARRRTGRRRKAPATAADSASSVDGAVPAMMWDSRRGWVQRSEGHGRVRLTAFTTAGDHRMFGLTHAHIKPTEITVVADSGCQSPIMGLDHLYRLGLKKRDLVRVKATATSISGSQIDIIGIVVLRLSGVDKNTGKTAETAGQVRVARDVRDFYISKQMMRDLGIIKDDFPSVQVAEVRSETEPVAGERASCGCLRRAPPPPLPERLPMEPTEANVERMKSWILDRYAASAFNKCPHMRLPMMTCDPIRIHIDPEARPVAATTASTVPLHLREAVKEQLEEDVALGTIEKVPIGVKTMWQARMHVVPKPDGTPRRTVDLRHLNENCLRETEHIVPPWKQARSIPAGVWKTKSDAWNGYHSCPLDERDRHLTTFITEWGRYWYRAAPQGFLASGDGYNQRYGRLIEDMPRVTRCVDDLAMWDGDLEEHWWRTLRYIDRIARNGIIISPAKFEFCSREIEFAGFRITETGVKPLAKYLDAVAKFPRPTNITDVRSFFGLICQLSHYAQLRDLMAPFKPFLSPRTRFEWSDELEEAFIAARKEIVAAIEHGVEIFEPGRQTVISPDWSKKGIGYFLYQKWCDCPSRVTTCCEHGWRVVLAGSRFLTSAEQNYWPTEGEALAVVWALEDSRFFTLGCTDLEVQTDHKPLVKLLGDRTLDEIQNRRLVNLKERTFPWKFGVSWVAGRTIPAPDATSRHPQARQEDVEPVSVAAAMDVIRVAEDDGADLAGDNEMAAGTDNNMRQFRAVTREIVKEETAADRGLQQLIEEITSGFHNRLDDLPADVAKFWQYREGLYVVDGIVMLGERAVIPKKLRKEVLHNLHGAHQGVSQMLARAATAVFWPGITADVQEVRDQCEACGRMAPSQRPTHPVPPVIPTGPFEAVASDYFDLAGNHYLIVVDRLTNWADVRKAKPKTDEAGTQGLMDLFREVFRNYGVPLEISSDGGPEYKSREFENFLQRWGVRHRLSSAHHAASNGRAEVAVKAVKRALRENTDADGNVDNDRVTRALLTMRNTPDRDTGNSPAMLLLGRPLRDTLPLLQPWGRTESPVHRGVGAQPIRSEWHDRWDLQEEALRHRLGKNVDKMEAKAHDLRPLDLQAHVRVQNQSGNAPRRWDKTGTVVGRNLALDKYWVKMDGSRRVTERNRKFLRLFTPARTGLEKPAGYQVPQLAPEGRIQPGQDKQKQDNQKQDTEKQDYQKQETQKQDDREQESPDRADGPRYDMATPARSPGTPEFVTPRSSPMAGQPGPARSTPRPEKRPMAKRRVTFNLEQGEPEPQAASEPPPREVPPPAAPPAASQPPARTNDRPRRERTKPAWQLSGDFDMEASAFEVRCSDKGIAKANNSVVGVSGHAEDDSHETGSTGRLETGPPDGGYNAARVADMLGEAAAVLGRILAIVANDSDVEDKNGKD